MILLVPGIACAVIVICILQSFTAAARSHIEAFIEQSTTRFWQGVFVNVVTVTVVSLGLHTVRTAYGVALFFFWTVPNLRNLYARLTHAQELIVSTRGQFLAFFGVRAASSFMRERPEQYARWKRAGTVWLASSVLSLGYSVYDLGVRSPAEAKLAPSSSTIALSAAAPTALSPIEVAPSVEVILPKGTVLRVGPGRRYKRARSLPRGETFVVLDDSVPGWLKVQGESTTAWVVTPSSYVESGKAPR